MSIIARLYNNETSSPLNGSCYFYFGNNYIGTSNTNSSGNCLISYDKSTQNTGSYNIKVNYTLSGNNIGEKSIVEDIKTINLIQFLTTPVPNNMRLIEGSYRYRSGDAAILNLTLTKAGTLYDPQNIKVEATTSALEPISTHYYPGDIVRTSTGKYYSKTIVNSSMGDHIRWSIYASDDNYNSYLSSAVEADRNVLPSDGFINISLQNSNIKLFDRNRHGLASAQDILLSEAVIGDVYDIEFEFDSSSLRLERLNLTSNISLSPSYVSNYEGEIPSQVGSFTGVLAFNSSGLSLNKSKIVLATQGIFVTNICKCEDWNFSSDLCSGSWQCDNANSYEGFAQNSTHFEFEVSSFSGYAGGGSMDSFLHIYDSTDPEGGSHTIYPNQNANFYANYSNTNTGESINGTNISCLIKFKLGGSWTQEYPMSFNSGTKLYTYSKSFSFAGTHQWNVTCDGTSQSYEVLQATDSILISSHEPLPGGPSGPGGSTSDINATLPELIEIVLEIDSVDFGNISIGETYVNLTGLHVRNIGNYFVNVDMNSTSLWKGTHSFPGNNFLFKIGDAGKGGSESGTFDSSSLTEWTPFSSVLQTAIFGLNFNSSHDTAAIQINITVPVDEPAGEKESIIYLVGSAV
jgi:hypothetical protein